MYEIKKNGGLFLKNKNNAKWVEQIKMTINVEWVGERKYNLFLWFLFLKITHTHLIFIHIYNLLFYYIYIFFAYFS